MTDLLWMSRAANLGDAYPQQLARARVVEPDGRKKT
jgi:hypothetical protein